MRVRRADVDDAAAIAPFHLRCWHEAYAGFVPRTALDQHGLIRAQVPGRMQAPVGRAEGDRNRRGHAEVEPFGQRPARLGRHRPQLRVRAVHPHCRDRLTDREPPHVATDFDNLASGRIADDVGIMRWCLRRSIDRVATLDRHGLDLNQEAIVGAGGVRHIDVPQYLGLTRCVVRCCFHAMVFHRRRAAITGRRSQRVITRRQ